MFALQKVNDISFALIRVAVQIRRSELRARIENLALDLLETAAAKDWEAVLAAVDVARALTAFGKTIYQIEPINARILDRELDNLSDIVKKEYGFNGYDVSDIFNRPSAKNQALISNSPIIAGNPANNAANQSGNGQNEEYGNNGESGNGNGINSTIRQSAIIDRIKQSGKASLKDLITEFPDVSERTIRYDLHKLCGQGVLERIGNGGPSTHYVARL